MRETLVCWKCLLQFFSEKEGVTVFDSSKKLSHCHFDSFGCTSQVPTSDDHFVGILGLEDCSKKSCQQLYHILAASRIRSVSASPQDMELIEERVCTIRTHDEAKDLLASWHHLFFNPVHFLSTLSFHTPCTLWNLFGNCVDSEGNTMLHLLSYTHHMFPGKYDALCVLLNS